LVHLHQKCQTQDYQNKDRLSVCRLLLLQRKPKLGRTKPSTGPWVGHSWCKAIVKPKLALQKMHFWGGATHKRDIGYFHALQTNGQIGHTCVGPQTLRRSPRSLNPSLNRTPRHRGPRATPTTNANLHFLSKLLVYSAAGAEPSVFTLFWETKMKIKFFRVSQNTVHTRFTTTIKIHQPWFENISVFRWNSFSLWRSLCSDQGQNLRKLWRVPRYFASLGTFSTKIQVNCVFLTPSSKLYNKNGHCFQWWVQ